MKKFIALLLVLVMVLSLSTVAFAEARRHTLFGDTVGGIFDRVMTRVFDYSIELGSLIEAAMGTHDDIIHGIADGIQTMAGHFDPDDSFLSEGLNKCVYTIGTAFRYVYAFSYLTVIDK